MPKRIEFFVLHHSFRLRLLLAVLGLGMLGISAIIATGYWLGTRPVPARSLRLLPSPGSTSGWTTYRNERAGFAIQAPRPWTGFPNVDTSPLAYQDMVNALDPCSGTREGVGGQVVAIYFPIAVRGPHKDGPGRQRGDQCRPALPALSGRRALQPGCALTRSSVTSREVSRRARRR